MTLVISIKYKGGIIMASDSQATLNRGVPLKKLNQIKLFELKQIKNRVVIGGAGAVPFISKSFEEIQTNVKKNENITFSQIVDIAEKAVLHVARWYGVDRLNEIMIPTPKNKELAQFLPKDSPKENETKREVIKHDSSQQQIEIKPVDVILLIAGFDEDNEPQIYIIYSDGICEKQQCEAAIGSGAAYAEYILSQLMSKNMNEKKALKIAIHTVSEVRKIDPGVGGMPQVIKIEKDKVSPYEEKKIIEVIEELQKVQGKVESIWEDYITKDEI